VILTPEEITEVQVIAGRLSVEQIVDTLQFILARERDLYERMPDDPEHPETKLSLLHGMACLIGAAARLMPTPNQTAPQSPGTSTG